MLSIETHWKIFTRGNANYVSLMSSSPKDEWFIYFAFQL
jgi:hypothetical protein